MQWAADLFSAPSVSHTLVMLSLVILIGIALGNVRMMGLSLGVACVLFAGLFAGSFHTPLDTEVLDFTMNLGLILFVYSIGTEVGPGFFASFRRGGVGLNLAAAVIVLLGVLVASAVHLIARLSGAATAGLLAGAVTNTPSMAAAQETVRNTLASSPDAAQTVGAACALAYPGGVLGTILAMVVIQHWFRIDPRQEVVAHDAARAQAAPPPRNLNVELKNPQLVGQPLRTLRSLMQPDVVISRILRGDDVYVPRPGTLLQRGDVLHAVGPAASLDKLCLAVGDPTSVDLRTIPSRLSARQIVVTQRDVLGRSLAELDLNGRHDATCTRMHRSGMEFVPTDAVRLQFGDRVMVVGTQAALKNVAIELGDSLRELNQPNILPIFLGILLGTVVGSIPLSIPGIPVPLKLGLAGGPLLVAMCLSRVGRVGPVVWYTPPPANILLREFGIALFLGCVGLLASDRFLQMVTRPAGLSWIAGGAVITCLPLLVVGLAARSWWKMNFVTLCGLFAGSMTNPPALAFANTVSASETPTITYATVYPLVTCLRVVCAQLLIILLR